ncbi:hypothetical protein LguiA_022697 [Lonicera macranthoides]
MAKLCRRVGRFNSKKAILWRLAVLRRCFCSLWNQLFACWMCRSVRYRPLTHSAVGGAAPTPSAAEDLASACSDDGGGDSSDLVPLKISLMGDGQIGKTSFLTKYVGREKEGKGFNIRGVNQMDKTLSVRGARISFSLWEVAGGDSSNDHIPLACKDSVAMIFMFDLTSRCTLNSILSWYQQARKWNQTAIPVLVGTKFDDFVQLPIDLQWAIASQARSYAKAINATLFFSSATYNINVNKIFKFITAKLFNLPWNLERNLKVGEPIIDF